MREALRHHLTTRRSIPAAQLGAPGPDEAEVAAMLRIAARVPDHGKLAPWRFILYPSEARQAAAEWLAARAAGQPEEADRRKRTESARQFAVPPLVVGIVSTAAEDAKIPVWEQRLSAGAVCMNLLHAAAAFGFAAQWLTQWYSYDEAALRYLGVAAGERMAGLVHIGTPQIPPSERARPDVKALTTLWAAGDRQ
ncbi:MAG TPA: nitroreductase family protein [Afifellaceae bacterium]|nr:nitroreductase family protein [Afifellaceae bacterium]